MGINSTEVSYSFGQLGSTFINVYDNDIKPPVGKVFVAITFLEDATFDTDSGLLADSSTDLAYVGTNTASHAAQNAGARTTDTGSGGKFVDDTVNFQAGLTIYGRWTTIDLKTGAVIAYIGD